MAAVKLASNTQLFNLNAISEKLSVIVLGSFFTLQSNVYHQEITLFLKKRKIIA
jgi:hypothetical protein